MSEPIRKNAAEWRAAWLADRNAVDVSVDKVVQLTDAQIKRSRDASSRRDGFRKHLAEILERSAGISHDMLTARSQDEWSLAFALTVDQTLAHLGLAHIGGDDRTIDAMALNLSRLAGEMSKAFPDRRMVVEPWQRAIATLGEPAEPLHDARPHPHVDSLSRLVLTLRDTGPSLRDFRVLYVPYGTSLHIVRPA